MACEQTASTVENKIAECMVIIGDMAADLCTDTLQQDVTIRYILDPFIYYYILSL